MVNVNIINPKNHSGDLLQHYYKLQNDLETSINQEMGEIDGVININLSSNSFTVEVEENNTIDNFRLNLFVQKHQYNLDYYTIENLEDKLTFELNFLESGREFLNRWIEFRLHFKEVYVFNINLDEQKKLIIEIPKDSTLNKGKSTDEIKEIIIDTLKDIFLTADLMVTSGKVKVRDEDVLNNSKQESIVLSHKYDSSILRNNLDFKTFQYNEEPLVSAIFKFSNKRLLTV